MSIAPPSRYSNPGRSRGESFALHQQAERIEVGVVFHSAVVEDDGVGSNIAVVPDRQSARLQDAVFEQMRLENRVLVDGTVVSDRDEVELDQPCCVKVDSFADPCAQQAEIEWEQRGALNCVEGSWCG